MKSVLSLLGLRDLLPLFLSDIFSVCPPNPRPHPLTAQQYLFISYVTRHAHHAHVHMASQLTTTLHLLTQIHKIKKCDWLSLVRCLALVISCGHEVGPSKQGPWQERQQ